MRFPGILLVLLALLPTYSLADNHGATQCTYDNLIRRVVIMSEPGVSVPCEVHYYKDIEAPGVDQVLWSADSQAGYCEEKAAELVANLESWGWECSAAAAAPAMPAAPEEPEAPAAPELPAEPMQPEAPEEVEEAMDDTGDLVPADDKQ